MGLPSNLFVSSAIHEREVKLPDGSVHKLHFKELPAIEFRKFQLAEASDDDEVRASSMTKLIVGSLCEPDGKPAITLKEAAKLNSPAANALVAAILDVNGFGEKKDSQAETANGSGTS